MNLELDAQVERELGPLEVVLDPCAEAGGVRYIEADTRQNVLLYNPASELELPKLEHRLPRHVLTLSEAEAIMNLPDVRDVLGVRDRAILETFYSTGMRRSELVHLCVFDLDTERGTILIRQGKGKKDRMVPVGERAAAWIDKYLYEARPQLVAGLDEGALFLTNTGEPFTPNRLTQLVRNYVQAAELGKSGSCHLFRHTAATLMLEGGADIRYIQAMLGHAEQHELLVRWMGDVATSRPRTVGWRWP
jgi:integrase/recombinase XerD